MVKGILLASIATPLLVLVLFMFTGIVFYLSNISHAGFLDFNPVLGMLMGGRCMP